MAATICEFVKNVGLEPNERVRELWMMEVMNLQKADDVTGVRRSESKM